MLNWEYLENFAECQKEQYAHQDPFPHAIADGVFSPVYAQTMAYAFPGPNEPTWLGYDNRFEKKSIQNHEAQIPPVFVSLLRELNATRFITFLEALTGIQGLVPDPHMRGGGLHQTRRGGKLDIHVDFNWHERLKLDRRVNVLLYLNTEWDSSWGGALELWNADMTACKRRIDPVFNRMVIFNTTETSYHGHPEPLDCPVGVTRKSIAMYYYTNGRPVSEMTKPHSTLYQKRPGDETNEEIEELRRKRGLGRV